MAACHPAAEILRLPAFLRRQRSARGGEEHGAPRIESWLPNGGQFLSAVEVEKAQPSARGGGQNAAARFEHGSAKVVKAAGVKFKVRQYDGTSKLRVRGNHAEV